MLGLDRRRFTHWTGGRVSVMKDDLVRSGRWLFRWRSYVPLIGIALFLVALQDFTYPYGSHTLDLAWEMSCLGISLIGLLVRALTAGYAPARTSGRNTTGQMADSLSTTGMYSLVRHPIYLGNFLALTGPVLFPRSFWFAMVCALAFFAFYNRIMLAEEEFLEETFGAQYREWASRTPAFFPRFRGWTSPALPFSLRSAIKREYHGFFAVILLFTLCEVLGDYYVAGRWQIETLWVVILSVGAGVYVVIRIVCKTTRLLNVPGR